MENVEAFDWFRIFFGNENDLLYLLEIVFRVFVIYLFTVILIRYMGKRGNKKLSVFENVLIIALGSATGDSMFYPKVPLLYAIVVITIIVGLSRILQYLQLIFKPVNTFLDGKPVVLVKNGVILKKGLRESRIREEELYGMLRIKGIRDAGTVEYAFLERTGDLSVFEYSTANNLSKNILLHEILD